MIIPWYARQETMPGPALCLARLFRAAWRFLHPAGAGYRKNSRHRAFAFGQQEFPEGHRNRRQPFFLQMDHEPVAHHGKSADVEDHQPPGFELGKITCTPTPHLDAIYACVKLLSHATLERNACVRALEVQGIVAPIVPEARPAPEFAAALGAAA